MSGQASPGWRSKVGDDDDSDDEPTLPHEGRASSRIVTRGLGHRDSRILVELGVVGAVDVDVELTLADGSRHEGCVTLLRDGEGYVAFGDAPEHWISGDLMVCLRSLDSASFDRACMRLWLAALDVVP